MRGEYMAAAVLYYTQHLNEMDLSRPLAATYVLIIATLLLVYMLKRLKAR